jgi:hypothetical protein
LLSYERLSKKPLLFKSFTGLTVQEFDDIYHKQIVKKYENHEIKRLSCKRKENRKRKIGAIGGLGGIAIFHLPPGMIIDGLIFLAGKTGCGGLIKIDQLSSIGNIGVQF